MKFQHEILIEASVEATWHVLERIEDWPSFVPTVSSVKRLDDGPLQVGSRARLRQPGLLPLEWTVTRLEPPNVFVWRTRLPGLTMTAGHELQRRDQACVQVLSIALDGLGASVAGRLFGKLVDKALAAENAGFKERAEG